MQNLRMSTNDTWLKKGMNQNKCFSELKYQRKETRNEVRFWAHFKEPDSTISDSKTPETHRSRKRVKSFHLNPEKVRTPWHCETLLAGAECWMVFIPATSWDSVSIKATPYFKLYLSFKTSDHLEPASVQVQTRKLPHKLCSKPNRILCCHWPKRLKFSWTWHEYKHR